MYIMWGKDMSYMETGCGLHGGRIGAIWGLHAGNMGEGCCRDGVVSYGPHSTQTREVHAVCHTSKVRCKSTYHKCVDANPTLKLRILPGTQRIVVGTSLGINKEHFKVKPYNLFN